MTLSLIRLPFRLIIWGAICLQLTVGNNESPHSNGNNNDRDGNNDCHAQDTTTTANAVNSAGDGPMPICTSSSTKTTESKPLTTSDNSKQNNREQKWKWDPNSKSHPCNIHRISHSELLRLYDDVGGVPNLYPYPLVIYDDDNNNSGKSAEDFVNRTTLENLPSNFPPNFHVTLTGSDSLSSHRRTIPLTQYLHEVTSANNNTGTTLPNQLGNETWYLFGETFSNEWDAFLQHYTLPSCQSCTPLHRLENKVALSFGVGNVGSGVQWHLHGPGFSETIHGRKHWVLYPPEERPEYDLDYASRHWMENTYPLLEDWNEDGVDLGMEKKKHDEFARGWKKKRGSNGSMQGGEKMRKISYDGRVAERGPSGKKPWECTIHRGEMIYFPDQWHHATINLEKYTVFVSSFTTEHEG